MGAVGAAGAAVMEAWGTANAPATKARIIAEYFIVIVGIVRCGSERCVGIWCDGKLI
jgi:hypothetical protein